LIVPDFIFKTTNAGAPEQQRLSRQVPQRSGPHLIIWS